jgi:glycosyltransferase involved in cell wall biosynthesis
MRLSILICSLVEREESLKLLLSNLLTQLGIYTHYAEHDKFYRLDRYVSGGVEIIVCTDEYHFTVGQKRNLLLKESTGEYVCYIDDDDNVERNYIPSILPHTSKGYDVIVFWAAYYSSGKFVKGVDYSMEFKKDAETATEYLRRPNHLMPVKRSIALQAKFESVNFGEDAKYAAKILPLLKTQYRIPTTLYHYYFNPDKSATSGR